MASTFLLLGEICSTLFLAVGEVGAILVRGLFSLIVGLCDVLAACACCCQVPFAERPDRAGYTYTTLALRSGAPTERMADKPKFSGKAFARVQSNKLFALPAVGKKTKKAEAAPATSASEVQTPNEDATKPSSESVAVAEKVPAEAAPAEAKKGWFGW